MENNGGIEMKKISMIKILKSVSGIMDLVSNTVVSHHKKVAYLCYKIGKLMNLAKKDLKNLVMAALIHDIGIFYIDNVNIHEFTFDDEENSHALIGYYLLNESYFLSEISSMIRYHHTEWNKYTPEIPNFYSILHLADQVAFLSEKYDIYNDSKKIGEMIKKGSGMRFWPEAVEAYLRLSFKEYFILDLKSVIAINREIDKAIFKFDNDITINNIIEASKIVGYIVDFRSTFTATHSIGVAIVAKKLSKLMDFSVEDQLIMEMAAYLHDIGKLVVPSEILNKNCKLNQDEWRIMRSHTYYTYQVLDYIDELPQLKEWAAYHHEKLDGTGYPFHIDANKISKGARIMAVADIFTAITEGRPYQDGMNKREVRNIVLDMVRNKKIDKDVVNILLENYREINDLRRKTQLRSKKDYQDFRLLALSKIS